MARRTMHDHRRAPAWPPRPLPAAQRRAEEESLIDEVLAARDAEIDAAERAVEAFLFDLTAQELAGLDPADPRLWRSLRCSYVAGRPEVVGWPWRAYAERRRRAALTAHERIAEARERTRQKAVA